MTILMQLQGEQVAVPLLLHAGGALRVGLQARDIRGHADVGGRFGDAALTGRGLPAEVPVDPVGAVLTIAVQAGANGVDGSAADIKTFHPALQSWFGVALPRSDQQRAQQQR